MSNLKDAYDLFHQGILSLSEIENNGIHIDLEYVKKQRILIAEKLDKIESDIFNSDAGKLWKAKYGRLAKLNSGPQLSWLLFDELKLWATGMSRKMKPSVDKNWLSKINHPICTMLLEYKKWAKVDSTYLKPLLVETDETGLLHPSFSLNLVESMRSSAQNPNLQNQSIRVSEIAKIIRGCFIPPKGWRILEIDHCFTGDTLVETTRGQVSLKEIVENYNDNSYDVYCYDKENKKVAISKVTNGMLVRKNAEVWKVTLDNGKIIKGTPDHKFIRRDGSDVLLKDLKSGDSLMPFYKNEIHKTYGTYYKINMNNGERIYEHTLVYDYYKNFNIKGSGLIIHHIDSNGMNNKIENLELLTRSEHGFLHITDSWKKHNDCADNYKRQLKKLPEDEKNKLLNASKLYWESLSQDEKKVIHKKISDVRKEKGLAKGEKNPMFGKHHMETTLEKISIKAKQRLNKRTLENIFARKPQSNNESGISGVSFSEYKNKWISKITIKKKAIYLGEYNTKEEAIESRKNAEQYYIQLEKDGKLDDQYNHKVVSIEFCGYEDVYNITVDKYHTYALGAGVIVNNCALEVRGGCCVHHDSTLIKYIEDGFDMHSKFTRMIFSISEELWTTTDKNTPKIIKGLRYAGKNGFSFSLQYGNFYAQIAMDLWKKIDELSLCIPEKVPLRDHLKEQFFKSPLENKVIKIYDPRQENKEKFKKACDFIYNYTDIDCSNGYNSLTEYDKILVCFFHHIEECERIYYEDEFYEFNQWRKDFYAEYLEKGYFDNLTGFRFKGVFSKNQCLNFPVQSISFHFLLWALVEIQKEIKSQGLKSKIFAEIHDSMALCVPHEEVEIICDLFTEIMTKRTIEHFPWICVPLEVEVDIAPINLSWYYKVGKKKYDVFLELLKDNKIKEAMEYNKLELKYDSDIIESIIKEELKYMNKEF